MSRFMGGRGETGMTGVDPNQPQEDDYVVQWLDQQRIRDELYNSTTPSAKKIWKTQEDLWVYEALLGIIARTNEAAGSDRASNAAVRIIQSLEVGKLAAQESRSTGRIDLELPAAGGAMGEGGEAVGRGGAPGGEMMSREGSMMMGEGGFGERGGAADDAAMDAALFDGRYVDEKGQPIAAAGEITPDLFGKEFKRLPIRMDLYMDQRWLPQLITECANAPLQVEVEQVRINPATSGMGGGGGREGGRFGGGGGGSSQPGEPLYPAHEPHMKPVVIQGIIYIFNPPSEGTAAGAGQVAGVQ